MDEEGFLKLTNHKDHPTNKGFKVFFFYKKIQSDYFEKDEQNTERGYVYLFGIKKTDNRNVLKLNYETLGKYRTPFITKKWAQYLIIIVGVLLVTFAILSYYKNL